MKIYCVAWNAWQSLHAVNSVSVADYSKGFGGKFGVQTDRKDASAVGYDHQEKLEKHESQKGLKMMLKS